MADNTTLNAGSGGDTIATDDVAGVKYQQVKLVDGTADSTAGIPGSATDGLLVNLGANNDVTVTGTVTANAGSGTFTIAGAVTNAGTFAVQESGGALTALQLLDDTVATTAAAITAKGVAAVGTDGTNARILKTDTSGELQVDVLTVPTITVNPHAVTNAGTFVVQENGAALTALQLIDDSVQVLGTDTYTEATSKGITLGAVRRDADTTLVNTTNEFAPLQVDANGRLKVEAFSGETLPVSLTSTTITGTVATTQSGAWDVSNTELPAAAAAADNFANPTTSNIMAMGMVWDGATWDRAAGTSADGALVNLGANNDVTITSGTVTTLTTITNDVKVVGNTADDSPASGAPVPIGATARTTNRTAVGDGDVVRIAADDLGRQVTVIGQVRDLMTHAHTQIASSSAETTILAAGAAGVFHDLTQLVITNQTATAVNVTIKDATAGTTRMIVALAASGGAVIPFHRPLTQSTAANNWTATLSSASVTVNFLVQAEKNV